MEHKKLQDVAHFSLEKHVLAPVFASERTKVLLLCLSAGQTVPAHSHHGCEVTLQVVRGKGALRLADGDTLTLSVGDVLFLDGGTEISPRNPFEDDFELLIHLIRK